jgi:hypothetical protein
MLPDREGHATSAPNLAAANAPRYRWGRTVARPLSIASFALPPLTNQGALAKRSMPRDGARDALAGQAVLRDQIERDP